MKNVLIIEDSKMVNNVIKGELLKLDFGADQAFTLAEAREFLSKNIYKMIILDLHLPDGEGSELIANIQSLTKTKVIVLTSSQDAEIREELFQYGILDYIIKDKNLIYSITEVVKIINSLDDESKGDILIIDDSKFVCKQIQTILEPRNYNVKMALNAKKGLDLLNKGDFDLVILDMELPDIHGLKVLEMIRKDIKHLSLAVIVLSGTSTPEIVRSVLKNGANDFLQKPFVFEEFILKIDLWVDYFKKEKMLEEKTYELKFLNENLENLVFKEVEKNRDREKFLFQQSRNAQMGEMIAMIAHQWRQPLNIIATASTIINQKVKQGKLDSNLSMKLTSKISNNIDYLSSTINDFRDFFKPDKETRETNFEIILTKALTLVESSISSKKVKIEKKIYSVKEFCTYENELVQVVLNLIKNAEDVLIERKVQNPKIMIMIKDTQLSVYDNAGGVPDDVKDKIFDPYFSTKSHKEGTGLGLYMSKMIVQEHCRGTLTLKNRQKGANFTISLPVDQDGE
jgi:DNA-binding response OmpR family regulator